VSERTSGTLASSAVDPILVQLIDELADRLQAGEPVDWDSVALEHPDRVEQVRKMLPAIAAIAELGSVTGRGLSRSFSREFGPDSVIGELGDYRILREVGRGGMGVVYEAVQISLGRRVALKVLPFAPALDARQLQRFQNEARAAAHLNHVNIVPVYAVGCERGVHYYAMQFIEGQSLSVLIEDLRRIEGRAGERAAGQSEDAFDLASELASGRFAPARNIAPPGEQPTRLHESEPSSPAGALPGSSTQTPLATATGRSTRSSAYFRTVARMGIEAAEALEHAHHQGVIHRDVKPSNLLVDVRGNLWVTDFGLARFQNEAGLTMTGDLLGTLRYMSPEQALGKSGMADYRTDIYSLGATLYELLTLRPATPGLDRQEILRTIADNDPPSARKLNASIPLDLETILLKAMAKEPAGRYTTAQELADDLERYLKDEPIRARRSTFGQRLGRWARRHQPLVWSAGVSAVLLLLTAITALAVSNVLIRREEIAKERALEAARASESTAQSQERVARQNLLKACEAADLLLTRVAEERLLNRPQMESVRRALLEDAARFYEELVKQEGNNRDVRHGAAKAYARLAYLQFQLRETSQALETNKQSITLLEQLRADEPGNRSCRFDLATAYWQLGSLSLNQGRPVEAERAFGEAIALCTRLVAEDPGESAYQLRLATAQCDLGSAFLANFRLGEAETACSQALAWAQRAQSRSGPASQRSIVLARCHYQLGVILGMAGQYSQAEQNERKALEIARMLVAEPDPQTDFIQTLADVLVALADTLQSEGRLTESRDAIREAVPLSEKLAGDFPGFPLFQAGLESGRHSLYRLLEASGAPREAEETYERAVATLEQLAKASPHTPKYRVELARTHRSRGNALQWTRPKAAEVSLRKAILISERAVADFPQMTWYRWLLANCRIDMINLLLKDDRPAEAEPYGRQALAEAERLAAEDPNSADFREQLARSREVWGTVLKATGRPAEAEAVLRNALDLFEKLSGDSPHNPYVQLETAFGYRELALLLAQIQDRRQEAADTHRRELNLLERCAAVFGTGPDFLEQIAHSHRLWAFRLTHQGRLQESEASHRLAIKVLEQSNAASTVAHPGHRRLLGNTYESLASLLAEAGRRQEATETLARALELPPSADDAQGCNDLAWTLAIWPFPQAGDARRPVELAKRAVELVPECGDFWNTLGAARCRAGDWNAALRALEKADELLGAVIQSSTKSFVMATAHWHLGHKRQAQDWYDRGVAAMQTYAPKDPTCRRLRSDVRELIGVQPP
jgi:eukaryotic-like serine/threonine-protein kinase